jgi:hypothetical protein
MTRPARTSVAGVAILALALTAAAEPAKAPEGADKDKSGWKSLFDGKSLDGWKPCYFNAEGKAHVKDGAIVLEKGGPMTGVACTRGDFPTSNYEVSLEGKKVEGDDFFCTTTFPVGDSFCTLVVGGWGGTVVGLSSIDGADASMNETRKDRDFARGRWYSVRLRVAGDRIQAWIDEEKLVDVDTKDKKLSIRIECRGCRPFGIATYNTTGAIRNVRVRTLAAAEKKPGGKE